MPPMPRPINRMGLFRPLVLIAIAIAGVASAPGICVPAAGDSGDTTTVEVPQPGPVVVRFIEPAPPGLILGETRVVIEARTSSDERIIRVEVFVDGRLLTILEHPPYAFTWNAGARFLRRVLRAVATDSAGRTGEAIVTARPLYIGQYEEVRLVSVYATVRDRKGRTIRDLDKSDFEILEDGVPQTVSHFTSARVPLTVALLVDASNSMNLGGKIELARRAAEEFVEAADPEDRLMVRSFNDSLHGTTHPASNRAELKKAIREIRAEGGTALYDAVYRMADSLKNIEGRRAIVLLSDGRDQALEDNEPGSLHLFEEALEKSHRSDVAIYAIGLGHRLDREMDLRRVRSLKEILSTFSVQTGGRPYFPDRARQLSRVYRQIAEDLKTQFTLAYSPTNESHDGRWRSITVRVKREGLQVDARSGYYAPTATLP